MTAKEIAFDLRQRIALADAELRVAKDLLNALEGRKPRKGRGPDKKPRKRPTRAKR